MYHSDNCRHCGVYGGDHRSHCPDYLHPATLAGIEETRDPVRFRERLLRANPHLRERFEKETPMPKPTCPPPDLPAPPLSAACTGFTDNLDTGHLPVNLDTLTLEEVEAMRYVYKHLTTYCNERAKLLRLQQTHGFVVKGSLSIAVSGDASVPQALPGYAFEVARGCLLGMAHIYNRLPEWARWPKVWRQCVGFDGPCPHEGELIPCPFAEDVHGDKTLMPLCERCATLRGREV